MKRTCINNVAATIQTLQQCIKAIHQWCSSKTTSAESIEDCSYLVWHITQFEKDGRLRSQPTCGNDTIRPATVVRDLGVLLDSELLLKKHISKVASICYFHVRRLKPIRRILGRQITTSLVTLSS